MLGDEEIRTDAWFREFPYENSIFFTYLSDFPIYEFSSFAEGLLTEYKNAFLSQKVAPPWLPDIDDELDASYFGSHVSIEKEVLSKKKEVLDKKTQQLFEGF